MPKMMIDTQILSYAFKKGDVEDLTARISSVVACEFLEMYPVSGRKPKYIVPMICSSEPFNRASVRRLFPRNIAPHSYLTDKIVIDFNNQFPTLIEYSSKAIAGLLQSKDKNIFRWATVALDRSEQKRLEARFTYMCRVVDKCVPLTAQTTEVALDLLEKFLRQHSLKGRFRNSLNDLLILATAIRERDSLSTEDSLLARFAASQHGAEVLTSGQNLILDFKSRRRAIPKKNMESKGYVNRGWKIASQKASVNL